MLIFTVKIFYVNLTSAGRRLVGAALSVGLDIPLSLDETEQAKKEVEGVFRSIHLSSQTKNKNFLDILVFFFGFFF